MIANEPVFRVLRIERGTTVDGPGFRTAIYLAGCSHHCPGCHNPQSWDPDGGQPMTLPEILAVVDEEDFNVTLTGGDPLYHPALTKTLVDALADSGRTVWLYTGYTWEQIQDRPELREAVARCEAVVEGPFVESLRDITLQFRGSSNQRIIRLKG